MSHTKELKVLTDSTQKAGVIRLNPNDGFDIGLMTYQYADIKIFANCSAEEFNTETTDYMVGEVTQENECTVGTVILNQMFTEKIGNPETIRLIYHDGKVMILSIR